MTEVKAKAKAKTTTRSNLDSPGTSGIIQEPQSGTNEHQSALANKAAETGLQEIGNGRLLLDTPFGRIFLNPKKFAFYDDFKSGFLGALREARQNGNITEEGERMLITRYTPILSGRRVISKRVSDQKAKILADADSAVNAAFKAIHSAVSG